MNTWILTDGRTGTENNARGLAEWLELSYKLQSVRLRHPWKTFAPWLRSGLKYAVKPSLNGPWPDLVISAGRTPAVAALYVRQRNPATRLVHITDPGIDPRHFDLVIAPAHDRLSGANVVTTTGALHRVTPAWLATAKAEWEPRWAHLPRPWRGILLGGSSRGLTLTYKMAQAWLAQLRTLPGSLLVVPSRRTDPEIISLLSEQPTGLRHCYYTDEGPNPYAGILACGDDLFVTNESVNMLSEAASTGKPLYTLNLNGAMPKYDRFNARLKANGHASDFALPLPEFTPKSLNDMETAADAVRELLNKKKGLRHE